MNPLPLRLLLPLFLAIPLHAEAAQTLRDAFAGRFHIGVAVNGTSHVDDGTAEGRLVARQFSSLTAENAMKWASLHPQPDRFRFEEADRIVAFAESHGMQVIGHTLIWHEQTPRWVFEDGQGGPATPEVLLERMRTHIQAVVGRYRGRIAGWDVVNEALNEDGSLRDTPWRRVLGDAYLEHAFRFAHQADPDAELYYNDYRLEVPSKRRGALEIVRRLRAASLRIDAVGTQGHLSLHHPPVADQERAILDFHAAGIRTLITELDVDVLPGTRGWGNADIRRREAEDPAFNPYRDGLPGEIQAKLADRYGELFRMYSKHQDKVGRVTFWGVNDGHSWLNNFPIRGRTNHALLFDRENNPKPAFEAVIQAATH